MKTLVILPTYNEASNITNILRQLHEQYPEIDILHIDDNSPDGTAEIALEFGLENTLELTLAILFCLITPFNDNTLFNDILFLYNYILKNI